MIFRKHSDRTVECKADKIATDLPLAIALKRVKEMKWTHSLTLPLVYRTLGNQRVDPPNSFIYALAISRFH